MNYSHEVEKCVTVKKGPHHGPAPIPEEGKWVKSYQISDISGLSHGVGWCAPQQGACKLTLNVKDGIVQEALVETLGCSGMTHSAAMAAEILPGKTLLECLNTDLVCDAINVAMREIFKQLAYGRSQTAFSEGGLPIGASLEDLGKGLRSQVGTMFSTGAKGVRYMEMAEGYVLKMALDENGEVIGYKFVKLGKMLEDIRHGVAPNEAFEEEHRPVRPLRRRCQVHRPPRRIMQNRAKGGQTVMANDVMFEGKERRMAKIEKCLAEYGIASLEEARDLCLSKGFDPDKIVKGVQPIAFENAGWAYTLGCAVALKKGVNSAAEAAEAIGIGLEAFCVPGSVAEQRNVGLGHGNLGAMLLRDETKCFAFLAGHESFAAAEGAIGIARTANRARKEPLRIILNGLGKDAAYIISRINGFTYVKTDYDFFTGELKIVESALLRRRARRCQVLRRQRRAGGRGHHEARGRGRVHHRQLHQPHPLPAPGGRHLQEVGAGERQEVLLRCFRRRHRPHPASRQHGCRPRFLRPDRLHGPYARRRPVRRLLLRARPRGDDGPHGHGQQPHGRRHRGLRRGRVRGHQVKNYLSVWKRHPAGCLFCVVRDRTGQENPSARALRDFVASTRPSGNTPSVIAAR